MSYELPKYAPRPIKLWDGETVPDTGDTTEALACKGWERKSCFLKSDQGGTMTIQVDIDGDGNFEDFDSVTVTADTLESYLTTHDIQFIRINFVPEAEATVDAYIQLGGPRPKH